MSEGKSQSFNGEIKEMTKNNFSMERRKGNSGEAAVKRLFEANGFKVDDLSYLQEYYHMGDIRASRGDSSYYIEVKTDTSADRTGNLVLELVTNIKENRDGWFKAENPHKFAFYLINTNEVILLDAAELKAKYKAALQRIIKTEEISTSGYYKQSLIGLVSINQLSNLCSSFRRIQL